MGVGENMPAVQHDRPRTGVDHSVRQRGAPVGFDEHDRKGQLGPVDGGARLSSSAAGRNRRGRRRRPFGGQQGGGGQAGGNR